MSVCFPPCRKLCRYTVAFYSFADKFFVLSVKNKITYAFRSIA